MSQFVEEQVLTDNPFPGLRPFKIEESHLFFGREGQSDEVLLKLSKSRFVGVIGPSGAGKSSFIYCGVLPILYGGFLTDASPNWEVVVTRPGAGPIDNLAESLLKNNEEYLNADAEEKKIKRTIFSTLLRSSSLGLVEAIEQNRKNTDVNYLILVDQFEELFRFKDSLDPNSVNETLAFVNLLIEAVNYPDSPVYVAITMRSDFIGDCAQFPELTRKINDSHYLIPQLTRDQKRKAIEGPVAVGGATIAPRLTQQLLNDLGDNPDQLPILQHALMRTWSYWTRYKDYEDEAVDLKHYEAIGTMAEALSMHANEAFDELTEDQKRICEVLFKAITEKRGENFGIRRPTRLNEIAAIADVSEQEVADVIDKFREQGRSLLTPAHGTTLGSKSMVDISHESLMRIWVRLKNWVDDEADAVQMYIRLAEAAAMHQVGKAGLWRPPDLQLALNWQAKHKPTLVWGQRYNPAFERTMIFLEYSKKEWETEQRIKELEQKRKLQRARIVALVLGTAVVICLLFLMYAFVQKSEADRQREAAEKNEQKAVAAQKVAEEQKIIAEEKEQEARRQTEIANTERSRAEQAQQAALEQKAVAEQQRGIAQQNEKLAKASEQRANVERTRAEENARIAKINEDKAKAEEQRAKELRYRAIAKAMAIKSTQLGDAEQEGLLAQQAFNFNTSFKGYKYDNDIYDGLYWALKKYDDPLTRSLAGHDNNIRAMVTRRAGNQIYTAGGEGKILRWTYQNNQWVSEVLAAARNNRLITSMDVSPDGNWMAVGGNFNSANPKANFVELYNLKNLGGGPKAISGFVGEVGDIIFTPNNAGFYARDNEGYSVHYCDLSTVKEVITTKEKIRDIALSPDGKKLAGAVDNGNKGILYTWDTQSFAASTVYQNQRAGLYAVNFHPDGNQIIIGDATGLIRIVMGGLVVRELSGHTSTIQVISMNHSGSFMATASRDKTVRLWNLKNLKEQPIVLKDHPTWVWSVAFTPDDEQILAGTQEQIIRSWPTRVETMSDKLCGKLTRNMTKDEWDIFVSEDLTYESTCTNLPANDK
jgi:WD40 repeat protein